MTTHQSFICFESTVRICSACLVSEGFSGLFVVLPWLLCFFDAACQRVAALRAVHVVQVLYAVRFSRALCAVHLAGMALASLASLALCGLFRLLHRLIGIVEWRLFCACTCRGLHPFAIFYVWFVLGLGLIFLPLIVIYEIDWILELKRLKYRFRPRATDSSSQPCNLKRLNLFLNSWWDSHY